MKERPILMSGPMVRAIIEGRKTQARRAVKPQPQARNWPTGRVDSAVLFHDGCWYACDHTDTSSHDTPYHLLNCPYGKPGDRLWVRETWRMFNINEDYGPLTVEYADKATKDLPEDITEEREAWWDRIAAQSNHDIHKSGIRADDDGEYVWESEDCPLRWRPSIHMPRWASRLTLEVVSVRVERLQDISEEDARAEGCPPGSYTSCDYGETVQTGQYRRMFPEFWDSIAKPGKKWADDPWVWCLTFKPVEVAK